MLKRVKRTLSNIIIYVLCITSLMSAMVSVIPVASAAGSSEILGTNAALGSPILSNNFTVDNWNKWEIIVWGIFLSNFCIPLVDDYESCFMTGKGGSNGTGYKALCFGSGNDKTNNDTIEYYVNYAAVNQNVTKKIIYVSYSDIENGRYTKEAEDPNSISSNSSNTMVRPATFRDFFFDIQEDKNKTGCTWGHSGQTSGHVYMFNPADTPGYTKIGGIPKASVPTFWVKNGTDKYVKLFDYRDSWDVQMISAMMNAVTPMASRVKSTEAFTENLNKFWEEDTPVYMDSFGNITVDGKMLVPAAINKHVTRDEKINLMNSWVINGYSSTYDNKQLVMGLKQDLQARIGHWDATWNRRGGYPAFGESSIGSVGLLYYDTDAVEMDAIINKTEIQYGDALAELFNCDISSVKTKYNLKFEISDMVAEKTRYWLGFVYKPDLVTNTAFMSSLLSNLNENGTAGHEILDYIMGMNGDQLPLYNKDGVISAVQVNTAQVNKANKTSAARAYYNFLYEIWSGAKSNEYLTQDAIRNQLPGMTWSDFWDKILENRGVFNYADGDWWSAFQKSYPEYKNIKGTSQSDWTDFDDNDTTSKNSNRIVKVYPVSNEMKSIAQVFGVKDGYEFAQYSTMIYMTYLDFYGISSNTSITGAKTKSSELNPDLYEDTSNVMKFDPNDAPNNASDKEKEDEIRNMTFMLLHPEQGRAYRQKLVQSSFQDFVYEWYNRIVYGGKGTYNGTASKSNSGFLAIEPYSENFFTKFIIDNYVDIAVYVIMGLLLAIIVLGLLMSKKLSWYVISTIVMVNTVLLVPSLGDIVPYITSNCIQRMFSDKMTYWSVSQGINNADLESQTTGYTANLTAEESNVVNSFIKQLSVIYTDRSLMVKQDISQKVTQVTTGSYSDIQSIQSARWILPMVMQQFSSDNNGREYIYKPLTNIWDDMSNMYWYFNPADAEATTLQSKTATSDQTGDMIPTISPVDKYGLLNSYFEDSDTDKNSFDTNINYHCYSYTINGNAADQVHLSFYYLPDSKRQVKSIKASLGNTNELYKNPDSFNAYIDAAKGAAVKENWATDKGDDEDGIDEQDGFEYTADSYDRTQRKTVTGDMPYLLSTESPIYYFYCVIKDCFDINYNVGNLIGQLQGQIEQNDKQELVRSNFMYATIGDESQPDTLQYTGYVRDILDLEELFKNMAPYMYGMQLTAGGFDGKSGVLGDDKITEELQYYDGMQQSWMYRCNWVTKLMENPDYVRRHTIGTADGTKVTVSNQSMPNSYLVDGGREMVFSEAQMHEMGLKESQLSLVELKCIETNKKVAKQWTLLLNYAGTNGLTKEVLMRQMATDATLIFCEEFSSTGFLNTTYTMYPQSLDLRYLSFDSVMKMLIMGATKNTSYAYGDTMLTLIEDTDPLTALLLLLDALICSTLIPFARSAIMAYMFLCTILALVRTIGAHMESRIRVAGGTFISNLMFSVITIIYYAMFSALMSVTSSDEILSVKKIAMSAGNPVWVLLLVLVIGCLYVFAIIKFTIFIFHNCRDMGFEAFSAIASDTVDNLRGALGSIGGTISNFFGGDSNSTMSSMHTHVDSIKGTGNKDAVTNVKVTEDETTKKKGGNRNNTDDSREREMFDKDMYVNNTEYDKDIADDLERKEQLEIDNQIEQGAEQTIQGNVGGFEKAN